MSHNFEKAVKGATKIKLAAPKSKYIETILLATQTGEAGVAEVFRTLQHRVRDSTWTIAFKALIVVHLMIREGQLDATLSYLAENPKRIAVSSFSEVQTQGHNIIKYSNYLMARAKAFGAAKVDYVRSGQGRLKRLTVDKGLLRETEIVQKQINVLLRCDLLSNDIENEITLTAFRLVTLDLLTLFSVMNEGTINVLEHYFEMSRPDSERALAIYKTFAAQTDQVVKFLGVARHFESATRLEIPKLKHASTDLAKLLEDDLNDPDFDLRRREYLAQKEAKKAGGRAASAIPDLAAKKPTTSTGSSTGPSGATPTASKPDPKAAPADLIDFFDSIEQNQQPLGQQNFMQQPTYQPQGAMQYQHSAFQPQPTGLYSQPTGFPQQPQPTGFGQPPFGGPFAPQGTNPFGVAPLPQPLQSTPTGAGFGGYSAQPQTYGFQSNLAPIPQNGVPSFAPTQATHLSPQPQQSTNPFRQSMLMANHTGPAAMSTTPLTRQNTNPFARRLSTDNNPQSPDGMSLSPQPQTVQPTAAAQPFQIQRTGTNPFARSTSVPPPQHQQQQATGLHPPAAAPLLRPNPTGSTNPFRQSAFINQQTGQGWHVSGQHGTMGGLEQLDTVPTFPRPGTAR